MNVWVTSDTHFGHDKAALWRGSPSVEAMNAVLIEKWNSRIKKGDLVYHLGDFAFLHQEEVTRLLRHLNGQIHLVQGNHDEDYNLKKCGFASVRDLRYVRLPWSGNESQKAMLCHYPMVTWRSSSYGAWMLHGHCHGNLDEGRLPEAKRLDVGVDTNNLYPYSVEEIGAIMANRGFDQVDHHRWKGDIGHTERHGGD